MSVFYSNKALMQFLLNTCKYHQRTEQHYFLGYTWDVFFKWNTSQEISILRETKDNLRIITGLCRRILSKVYVSRVMNEIFKADLCVKAPPHVIKTNSNNRK